MPVPHHILGVPPNASQEEVKKAFRRKSLECHPDLCPPSQRPEAEKTFKELAEAYAKLSGRAPITDWNQRNYYQQARRSRAWTGTRVPAKFSNAGLAFLICIPLIFTGVTLSQKYPRLAQESWRRHGLLNPPTNPFLRDEFLPRQRTWGERRNRRSDENAE
ncbi:probable chaperone protein DnaJ 2 at N-terminal half [Coccomyxa sp. Obi]|nr:probable chaperone protein DnaJ 2 at N-terminal half [Coccomyxa sp. Obi]